MSTNNINFHNKLEKFSKISLNIFLLGIYQKYFVGTQKQVRISHGKRTISVRVSQKAATVHDLLGTTHFEKNRDKVRLESH